MTFESRSEARLDLRRNQVSICDQVLLRAALPAIMPM
jgi:hypothetical protein